MKNLKDALLKILATITQVAKAYADGKIIWKEWIVIGTTIVGWVWIFKNLKAIKADIDTATEEGMKNLIEEIKIEFDIPQDEIEETIEHALSIVLLIFSMVGKKVPELMVKVK